jgi:MFS family permease
VSRDFLLLLCNRLVRAFGYGTAAVLLSFHLEARGLSAVSIGLVLTLGLATASLSGLISAAATVRFGRRRVLAATGVLMAVSGIDIALATSPLLLTLAALTGMCASGTMDIGPFISVEQAVLSETTSARMRNRAFARYSLTGALAFAAGAAVAGLVSDLAGSQVFFLVYAWLGLVTAVLPLLLTDAVEGPPQSPIFGNVRPLMVLAVLFALDSFGGGFLVSSVLVYWLHIRYGVGSEVLGPAFAAMSLLNAAAYELSGRIADRIGLINTMVATHLPSNVVLILVAFSPNISVAIGLLLVRSLIGNMDAPARQAYVVSIVKPSERAGALAITGALRGVALAFGPLLTGLAIQAALMAVPFVVGGSAKIVYDLGLYAGFRRRRAEHELPV